MDILQKLDNFVNPKEENIQEDEFLSDLMESVFLFLEDIDIDNLDESQFDKFYEILEMFDMDEENLDEIKRERVVRGGKKVRKLKCKKGYKAVNGKCVRMSAAEKRVRSKAAKRSAKKKKTKKSQTERKRQRSLKK
jgi:hypothetical protein